MTKDEAIRELRARRGAEEADAMIARADARTAEAVAALEPVYDLEADAAERRWLVRQLEDNGLLAGEDYNADGPLAVLVRLCGEEGLIPHTSREAMRAPVIIDVDGEALLRRSDEATKAGAEWVLVAGRYSIDRKLLRRALRAFPAAERRVLRLGIVPAPRYVRYAGLAPWRLRVSWDDGCHVLALRLVDAADTYGGDDA